MRNASALGLDNASARSLSVGIYADGMAPDRKGSF
jgi:hypothetical protein